VKDNENKIAPRLAGPVKRLVRLSKKHEIIGAFVVCFLLMLPAWFIGDWIGVLVGSGSCAPLLTFWGGMAYSSYLKLDKA
jgi:hypothetical protein